MENKPSDHLSNRFTITPTNGSAYADNETIKQTILAHEATFRKQVSELHRLYKVQKGLMALQRRRGETNGYSQEISYSSPSGGIRRVQQVAPPAEHEMRKPSGKFMKGKDIEHRNSGSTKEMVLQIAADADDSDDDVVIVWENTAKSLPRNSGSVVGTNLKLSIDRTSSMDKNLVTGLQPSGVSTVNALNKTMVGSSSTIKTTNFLSVGASSSQNQGYSSAGVSLNLPSLQYNLKEKRSSKFFAENGETRHRNSYINKLDDRSSGWLTHKKTGVGSSTVHYQSSSSIANPRIFAASSSNVAPKSLWQSSATDYTARRHYADAEMPSAQIGGRLSAFQRYDRLHSSQIPGGAQYQQHFPLYDCPKDVNPNNGARDATATLGQASENTPKEISWVRKKLRNTRNKIPMNRSQGSLSRVSGHSQILPGSMAYSEGSTRIFGFTISAATKKDSQCSSTTHMGTDTAPSSKGVPNMEMQFQNKKDGASVRNLIDLNVALPFIDGTKMDARLSEGDAVPQERDGPSNQALVITAAKNLMVTHKDKTQAGSSRGNILHRTAGLSTSTEGTVVCSSAMNNVDA